MAKKFGIFAETPIQTQPVPVKIRKGPPVLSLAVIFSVPVENERPKIILLLFSHVQ
jgi:hypothetical protein